MKSIKLILPVMAFLFAFAGAFASINRTVDIQANYDPSTGPCQGGFVLNTCTLTSPTNNVRCSIVGLPSELAFQAGACSVPIYRPNN